MTIALALCNALSIDTTYGIGYGIAAALRETLHFTTA